MTNSSFRAKDTKTTNKLVAMGEINHKKSCKRRRVGNKREIKCSWSLTNKKNIQAVDHITVNSKVQNDGTIVTDANFSSKDIVNTKTFMARENISSGTLDNSGVFSAGKDLIVKAL
ncbi:Uncharacterised protein [Fusobacterium necrophorum subsp. necrophorum]|nr:Uncharacterised protein [Fusobacterium necrophorum subsp. necrophorum]